MGNLSSSLRKRPPSYSPFRVLSLLHATSVIPAWSSFLWSTISWANPHLWDPTSAASILSAPSWISQLSQLPSLSLQTQHQSGAWGFCYAAPAPTSGALESSPSPSPSIECHLLGPTWGSPVTPAFLVTFTPYGSSLPVIIIPSQLARITITLLALQSSWICRDMVTLNPQFKQSNTHH